MKKVFAIFTAAVVSVAQLAVAASVSAAVKPALVHETLDLGESIEIEKTVGTPEIPLFPDIVFLSDSTGSMGSVIANVQTNATNIMNDVVAADPTAQFAATEYRDEGDAFLFQINQSATSSVSSVQAAINTWVAGGGGDTPEGQLNALYQIATDPAIDFRPGSSRIVVWFGDASGHDPSNGHSLADTITALQAAGITVIAIPVDTGFGDGLDNTGQATAITDATGGLLLPEATPAEVSDAIINSLGELSMTVVPDASGCTDLVVDFAPASQTVVSGDDAIFTETITVPNDPTLAGTQQSCTVEFKDDRGNLIGIQEITIHIPDNLPLAACTESVNPHGKNIPKAGQKSPGQNEDGFYELTAEEELEEGQGIYVLDLGSGHVFGPFANGDVVKYTQASGAEPTMKKMGSENGKAGAVSYHLTGQGDFAVYTSDGSDNESDHQVCLVPEPPK